MKAKHILTAFFLLFPVWASAQFYVTGDDPGKLKWNYVDTDSWRVIYPQGSDSLARTYATWLERYKIPVSRTTGYMVGQGDGRLMPALMHAYNTANGSVAWAPKRMDLFTIPTAYDPEPLPWNRMLSVHEGRHVTQMQFGMTNVQKPFNYAFGQMWNILVSILYPNMYFIEGDAVIAETALTKSGRGRTADFLNYYQVAFDQGDFRSWDRWLYGSQKHYTPNYYALGYLNLAGIRHFYGSPDFMHRAYDRASRKILDLGAFQTITREVSGKKYKAAFRDICDSMQVVWSAEAQARAPFMNLEPVTPEPNRYTGYSHTVAAEDCIYAVKSGYRDTPKLVRIDSSGRERFMAHFSYETSDLQYHDGKLYWTETTADPRWSMKADSKIRYMETRGGRKKNLTDDERMLFNPSFGGGKMAAARYLPEGGSVLYVECSGNPAEEFAAPDTLQLVETAWIRDNLYVSAISDNGFGVYGVDMETGSWENILAPHPVKIKDFRSHGDELMFTCDRTGVNELYHLDPSSGEVTQKTVTRYGASDFAYSPDGKYLYCSSQTLTGMRMFRIPVDSLADRRADFTKLHSYFLADRMAEQEAQAAGSAPVVDNDMSVRISEPKRYRKAAHAFGLHSWAPVYVSVDNIMNMSFDYVWQAASLGVSGIMQNTLATTVGEFGYSAHKDPYDRSKWRHSGHFKYTYSGLYPVFEFTFDINDRAARQYSSEAVLYGDMASISLSSRELSVPYLDGSVRTYIPFNLSSGGWYKGFIPSLSYRITNDMFNNSIAVLDSDESPWNPVFVGSKYGKNTFRHYLSGALRAYTTLATTNSAVYPRWGIGAEIGASASLESTKFFSPMGYAYVYGYIPGVTKEQGLKMTIRHQIRLNENSYFSLPLNGVLPRGLNNASGLTNWLSLYSSHMTKWTADYAIPIYIGDAAIAGGFFYIKRLVITPHFDYTHTAHDQRLCSVGSDLVFDLNSILWLGWPVSLGVSYSYNGLADFTAIKNESGVDMDRNHVGFVFNVTF